MFETFPASEMPIATKAMTRGVSLPALKPFMYYGGSSVLYSIMKQHDQHTNRFRPRDLDIYVDMQHEDFNIVEMSDYLHDLMDLGFGKPTGDEATLRAYKENVSQACVIHTCLASGENPASDKVAYFSSKYILDVWKYHLLSTRLPRLPGRSTSLDIIILSGSIDSHISEDYDLSVCKNFVDSKGDFHVYSLDDILSRQASIDADILTRNMRFYSQWAKFCSRLYKYSMRDFTITVHSSTIHDQYAQNRKYEADWLVTPDTMHRVALVFAGLTFKGKFPLVARVRLSRYSLESLWSRDCDKSLICKQWALLGSDTIESVAIWSMRMRAVVNEMQMDAASVLPVDEPEQ